MESSDQPRLALPDHTRIQVVAVIQAVIATAVAFGVPISSDQSVALLALAGVIGTMLIGADAAIRRERARNVEKLIPRASVSATSGPQGTETTVTVEGPVGADEDDDEIDEEVLELLRRILRARETARNGASVPKATPRAREAAPRRKGARTRT